MGIKSSQYTSSCRVGDGQCVLLRQRVQGSVRAIRAVGNTRAFLTETRVVADVDVADLEVKCGK